MFLVGGAFLTLCGDVSAQLNEGKVERDATGIYAGVIKQGRVKSETEGYPAETFTTGRETGKLKVPVKDGALSTTLTDSDLPTTNKKAGLKGKEDKSIVQRAGERVVVQASGSCVTPGSPTWTNGLISGLLDDKGTKWSGNCEAKAIKTFPPYMYDPDGEGPWAPYLVPKSTLTLIGLDVDGKG